MKIAALPFHCQPAPDWATLEARLSDLVAGADADLVVLPEYAAMQGAMVAGLHPDAPLDWRDQAAAHAALWVDLIRTLAERHSCHILAGSGPEQTDRGVVNRAWLCAPTGPIAWQDKMILTPYEREVLNMTPGEALRLFDTPLGRIGILICYDIEFPLLARAMAEAGADMILVPSCTDLPAGQTRVRQSARARAIENQCLIVQVPLIGAVPECDVIDISTGRAGVFAPPDHGMPPDGILAQGLPDDPAPVIWEGQPAAIAAPRERGQVGNFSHWPEQIPAAGQVLLSDLS